MHPVIFALYSASKSEVILSLYGRLIAKDEEIIPVHHSTNVIKWMMHASWIGTAAIPAGALQHLALVGLPDVTGFLKAVNALQDPHHLGFLNVSFRKWQYTGCLISP
eukprot:2725978-Amphidinium_carterae.2